LSQSVDRLVAPGMFLDPIKKIKPIIKHDDPIKDLESCE